ncbi:hypothetical protein [Nostoc sp. DSM 114159]|jgi:hypothetical protein
MTITPFSIRPFFQFVNISFEQEEWYEPDTYYQVLLVKPSNKTPGKYIETTILTLKRGPSPIAATNSLDQETFSDSKYKIDEETKKNLENYPRKGHEDYIGSYLPSSGVIFPKGFVDSLVKDEFSSSSNKDCPDPAIIGLNNFYDPIRILLCSRKISQLIAKTWWTYLDAKNSVMGEDTLWKQFTEGRWNENLKKLSNINILDGLIAREIFLLNSGSAPDYLKPSENFNIYYPLHSISTTPTDTQNGKKKFLIYPDSNAWQGIALSLLLTGHAYYEVTENGETHYHQISQPILSTGEIVIKYAVEVSWNEFKGIQNELVVNPNNNSSSIKVIAPYPPIPSKENLDPENIKKWANAIDDVSYESQENPDPDKNEEFPFYVKKNEEEYLVNVKYFSPPYPYIPLSCC